MKRSVIELRKELADRKKKVNEFEDVVALAESQEVERNKNVQEQIKVICSDNNYYCGVILSFDQILEILKLAHKTNEPVKISFNLYLKEDEPESEKTE